MTATAKACLPLPLIGRTVSPNGLNCNENLILLTISLWWQHQRRKRSRVAGCALNGTVAEVDIEGVVEGETTHDGLQVEDK